MGTDTEQAPASQCSQNQVQAYPRMSRAGLTSRMETKGKAEANSRGLLNLLVKNTPLTISSLPSPMNRNHPPCFARLSHSRQTVKSPHTPLPAASWEAFTSKSTGDLHIYEYFCEELVFRRRAQRDPGAF